jgi:peptidyl-prolyl cis-trans isomerase SurA
MSNYLSDKLRWTSLILLLNLFLISSTVGQESTLIDKVVGKVGGEYVLLSELESQYNFSKESNPGLQPEQKCDILETIIIQKLLIDQAKLDSVLVLDEEIESQLEFRIDRILRMMNGDEQRFFEFYGETVVEVRERMRDDIKQQILAERIQGQLITEVKITPNEVVDFFNNIPRDSLPYLNSEVELREIIIKPKVNSEEGEKARKKLEDIKARIVGGEDFATLAEIYSEDPGSASVGGDLGTQKRGTFVPEFEAAAYNLEEGELSELVKTEFGFHLIELLARKGNSIHVRHILIKPKITPADIDKAKVKIDSLRNLILLDSLDFSVAVKRFSDKNSQSYHNDGRLQNPSTGSIFFETSELPPEIYFSIENLEPGDISEHIEFSDPSGESYFRIVQVQSKTRPHQANLEQDYARIALFAKESKKNEYFFNWIQDKIDRTFIEVDPIYANCENLDRWMKKP